MNLYVYFWTTLLERITEEGAWRRAEDANSMWEAMADCIRRSVKEIMGSSRRGGNKMEGAWWWNEEVKEKVMEKKEAYAKVMNSDSDEEREIKSIRYKAAKKVAKRAVAVAKSLAFDRLYHRLEAKEGEKEVFRLARARARRARDLGVVRCIKDEDVKVLYEDAEIKERWQRFFAKLLNGEELGVAYSRGGEGSDRLIDPRVCGHITKNEIKEALKKMANGKIEGPNQIPVEVWKYLGKAGLEWLSELFNVIFRTAKMPREWRASIVIPLYKNRGDIQDCDNFRGIKLLSHTMKLWERVIVRRL